MVERMREAAGREDRAPASGTAPSPAALAARLRAAPGPERRDRRRRRGDHRRRPRRAATRRCSSSPSASTAPAPQSAARRSRGEIAAAPGLLDPDVRDALARRRREHRRPSPRAELETVAAPTVVELAQGQRVEVRTSPVAAAGIYAPGGRAAYPSSVLMCASRRASPASARIAVATPAGAGGTAERRASSPPARSPGSTRSTRSAAPRRSRRSPTAPRRSPAVDVIAGPGQPLRQRGQAPRLRRPSASTGSPGRASSSSSPTRRANPRVARARPLRPGRARRRRPARRRLARRRAARPGRASGRRARRRARRASPRRRSRSSRPPASSARSTLADASPRSTSSSRSTAPTRRRGAERSPGCVFVGPGGATAFGDYAAGSNHVLPTGGAARFGGPLGPAHFTPPHLRRLASRPPPPRRWRRTSPRWPAPRDSPCTASRPRRETELERPR